MKTINDFDEYVEKGVKLLDDYSRDFFEMFLVYPKIFLIGAGYPCTDDSVKELWNDSDLVDFFLWDQKNKTCTLYKVYQCVVRKILEDCCECEFAIDKQTLLPVAYDNVGSDMNMYAIAYYMPDYSFRDYDSNRRY